LSGSHHHQQPSRLRPSLQKRVQEEAFEAFCFEPVIITNP